MIIVLKGAKYFNYEWTGLLVGVTMQFVKFSEIPQYLAFVD